MTAKAELEKRLASLRAEMARVAGEAMPIEQAAGAVGEVLRHVREVAVVARGALTGERLGSILELISRVPQAERADLLARTASQLASAVAGPVAGTVEGAMDDLRDRRAAARAAVTSVAKQIALVESEIAEIAAAAKNGAALAENPDERAETAQPL